MTPAEREMAAASWQRSMAPLFERRVGPRKVALAPDVAPATRWNPLIGGAPQGSSRDAFVRSKGEPWPLPANDADIAFAPVTRLSRWIEEKALTSERLTRIYLQRIERFDPKLRCIITLTGTAHSRRRRRPTPRSRPGSYRGPLHGIPFGVKDLLDTAGIATTYGAEPFRNRVPADRFGRSSVGCYDAGAVLVAKLSLGALALNDIWFGGQTMNPWLLEEGASGSSAGPGAATAAGLVGFSIGSETGGSIVSPAMRCGITGLRPTFGRVPRTGAMTLCWSLDKLGPMTRSVEDAMLVLQAITGPDAGDASSVPSHLDFDATAPVAGLRVGYLPRVDEGEPGDRRRPRRARDRAQAGDDADRGPPSRLALQLADARSLQRGRGGVRGADAQRRPETAEGAGAGRVAQPVPPGAVSVSGRLRAGGPAAPPVARWRWRACSRRSICCSCRHCATRCSPSRTSPVIRRSRCAPGS